MFSLIVAVWWLYLVGKYISPNLIYLDLAPCLYISLSQICRLNKSLHVKTFLYENWWLFRYFLINFSLWTFTTFRLYDSLSRLLFFNILHGIISYKLYFHQHMPLLCIYIMKFHWQVWHKHIFHWLRNKLFLRGGGVVQLVTLFSVLLVSFTQCSDSFLSCQDQNMYFSACVYVISQLNYTLLW